MIGQAIAQIFGLTGAFNDLSDPMGLASTAAAFLTDKLNQVSVMISWVALGIRTGTGPLGGLRDILVQVAAVVYQQVIPALQKWGSFARADTPPHVS